MAEQCSFMMRTPSTHPWFSILIVTKPNDVVFLHSIMTHLGAKGKLMAVIGDEVSDFEMPLNCGIESSV